MKIIKPSAEIIFPTSYIVAREMLGLVEESARLCYKTEGKMGIYPDEKFIRDKIDRGHLSVIEHSLVSVKFIVDRGISHEIVRHRLASYSQESTRYCNYSQERFGGEIAVIKPSFENVYVEGVWYSACQMAEEYYFGLLKHGVSPQIARSVLPNSLKTELVMSANLREWRHFFKLRTSKAAHPQMREVTIPLLEQFKEFFTPIFDDIEVEQ